MLRVGILENTEKLKVKKTQQAPMLPRENCLEHFGVISPVQASIICLGLYIIFYA